MARFHAPGEPLMRLLQLPGEGDDDELAGGLGPGDGRQRERGAGAGEEMAAGKIERHGIRSCCLRGQMAKVRSKRSTSAPRWGAMRVQSMVCSASTSAGVEGV